MREFDWAGKEAERRLFANTSCAFAEFVLNVGLDELIRIIPVDFIVSFKDVHKSLYKRAVELGVVEDK